MDTLTCSHVNVFEKYLHWSCVSVKKQYTLQKDKWKCKKIERETVNDLHLHKIYMPYICLLTLMHTTFTWLFDFFKKHEHQSCISNLSI
jgi:hypothetical protein